MDRENVGERREGDGDRVRVLDRLILRPITGERDRDRESPASNEFNDVDKSGRARV